MSGKSVLTITLVPKRISKMILLNHLAYSFSLGLRFGGNLDFSTLFLEFAQGRLPAPHSRPVLRWVSICSGIDLFRSCSGIDLFLCFDSLRGKIITVF
jgi:hypothetical protein